ncbi:Phosphatidylinositol 4-phosphate 3-kinase C2 domain-containing subunit alpha [Geodia barretti]|uniref:Phosphatidylinositol 4-phosphate 3-kinase C2 domain-containing subunit alpha n=1 Tax=Geodia barretti TaxID=519541 RepID=A0AA35T2J4_GEOBA|nr:Phosphatidylinositol 4-phosphate 3-kinase C2 domain-containing subunit alpha [Geodia barretti]
MLPSGLVELSSADDVLYVRDALLPGRSDAEATYAFTKHIGDSLGSMATQINFFIHNLAQLKFSSPQAPPTLLTFVPQAYSIETDGRISCAVIVAYYMKYYPDAHAVYQIQVTRPQVSMTMLFRRYREFDELHCRLTLCFPGDELPGFPGKTYIPGKSRARETVERRLSELNKYISLLLRMEARISESDVVYTFFHCLIRDEQEKTRMEEESGNEGGAVAGKVKVHLMYDRKRESLSVMIRHVTDLVPREGTDTADPYVKMYLKPDVAKTTKQKTKIARRTLHPTYNETFTYKVPHQALSERSLELSVWDASILLNKQCLAVATVDLSTLQSELTSGCGRWVELHSLSQAPPTHLENTT